MLMIISGTLGALGLISILTRKNILGLMIGAQLLVLGASMIFVMAGISSGARLQGHLTGLFITLGGVAQLAGGYAVAIRLFYLKGRTNLDDLRTLKQ